MKYFKNSKITFFILFIFALFAYTMVIFINYYTNKSIMQEMAKSDQLNIVSGYKKKIDEWLISKKRIVDASAQLLSSLDKDKQYNDIKKHLSYAIKAGDFRSVYIGYEDDSFITGISWVADESYKPTKRLWYTEALRTNTTTTTSPYIDSDLFEDVVSISTPVIRDNKTIGVLSSDLILDLIMQDILVINLPVEGFAFLFNKQGNILVSPFDKNDSQWSDFETLVQTVLKQEDNNATHITYEYEKSRYILTFDVLSNTDWVFATVINEDHIYHQLNKNLYNNLIFAFCLVVFGVIMLIVFMSIFRRLFEHEEILHSFSNNQAQPLVITNKEGKIVFINRAYRHFFSISSKFSYSTPLRDIKHISNEIDAQMSDIIKFVEKEIYKNSHTQIAKKFFSTDLQKCWKLQGIGIKDKNNLHIGIMFTVIDISREYALKEKDKEHEQIMIQNSKMAASGEMISAITHQWRQPLNSLLIMLGSMEIQIKNGDFSDEKLLGFISKATNTINLMEETIQLFNEFFKIKSKNALFDVADTVNEVITIMDSSTRINNIDLIFDYDKDKNYKTYMISNYLKQVLINLISNSKDAIQESNMKNENGYIKISLDCKNGYISIKIEDNGIGIEDEFKDSLFQPLKTTKGEKGTGNGLYLCKLLINSKLGGNIKILSYKNPTIFEIVIPVKE